MSVVFDVVINSETQDAITDTDANFSVLTQHN